MVNARGVGSDRSGLTKAIVGRLRRFLDRMWVCLVYGDGEGARRSECQRLLFLLRAAEAEGVLSAETLSAPGWRFTSLLLRVKRPSPLPRRYSDPGGSSLFMSMGGKEGDAADDWALSALIGTGVGSAGGEC